MSATWHFGHKKQTSSITAGVEQQATRLYNCCNAVTQKDRATGGSLQRASNNNDMSSKVHNFPRVMSGSSLPIDEKHRGLVGLLRVCISFLTGSFLELDDNVINGLAQRQINEHTNVALVAALIMTITFSFIPVVEEWPDDWLKGAFELCVSVCNSFIVISVALSTSMILYLNLCKDDNECSEFLKRIGHCELIPYQCLWGAICSFGFCVTLLLFYHQLRDMEWWFLAIVVVSYVPAMIVLPYATITYIKHIHAVRINAAEKITVILNAEQVKEVFERFISDVYDGDLHAVPYYHQEFDDFMRYVLKKHNGRFIGRTTVVLMKKHFYEKLGSVEE